MFIFINLSREKKEVINNIFVLELNLHFVVFYENISNKASDICTFEKKSRINRRRKKKFIFEINKTKFTLLTSEKNISVL